MHVLSLTECLIRDIIILIPRMDGRMDGRADERVAVPLCNGASRRFN